MIIPNPDKAKYDEVTEAVEKNNGFCPCMINQTEDTKCKPCNIFIRKCQKGYKGPCHCGRYIND